MTSSIEDVTAVIVNFETPLHTRACVESLFRFYPTIRLVLVDNGSRDESRDYVRRLADQRPNVSILLNTRNRKHGPALDQAVQASNTPYVLTLDSDTEVRRGGFLEAVLPLFQDPLLYTVGQLRYKSKQGLTFGYDESSALGRRLRIPYIHPWAMILDRQKYLTLPPFIDHGAPAIRNMRAANERRYRVEAFPISDFITHHVSGTLNTSGWGITGRLKIIRDHALNRFEGFVSRDPTIDRRPPADPPGPRGKPT